MAQLPCPKCAESTEEGFILDVTQRGYLQTTWVRGTPEPSFWTSLKLKGKIRRPVVTLRCSRCGYLESYAQDALPARELVRWPFLITGFLLLITGLLIVAWAAFLLPRASRERDAAQLQICRDKYATARTARDSAVVDLYVVPTGARSNQYVSCGSLQRSQR